MHCDSSRRLVGPFSCGKKGYAAFYVDINLTKVTLEGTPEAGQIVSAVSEYALSVVGGQQATPDEVVGNALSQNCRAKQRAAGRQ